MQFPCSVCSELLLRMSVVCVHQRPLFLITLPQFRRAMPVSTTKRGRILWSLAEEKRACFCPWTQEAGKRECRGGERALHPFRPSPTRGKNVNTIGHLANPHCSKYLSTQAGRVGTDRRQTPVRVSIGSGTSTRSLTGREGRSGITTCRSP